MEPIAAFAPSLGPGNRAATTGRRNGVEDLVIDPRWEATFVPLDPPRASYFALWDPADVAGLPLANGSASFGSVDLRLVVPFGSGPLAANVVATRLPLRDAIEVFGALTVQAPVTRSVRVWATVVRSALGLVARGRLLPWVSPDGWDAWRVDPLDRADHGLVEALADAMPAIAHCHPSLVPTGGDGAAGVRSDRPRGIGEVIVDPVHAIRACYDGVADRFVRTAAAATRVDSPLFAQLSPTRVPQLRPWVDDLASEHCAAAMLTMTVDPVEESDAGPDDPWRLRYQLQSRQDPSLLVDAADLWRTPDQVVRLLGSQAEVDLLAGLRRAAGACSLFADAWHRERPDGRSLDPEDLDRLLDALDDLSSVGIEVRWPAALVAPRLERRLVARSAPGGSVAGVGGLPDLVGVDWEFLLDGTELTPAELTVLANAKRSVVPIRGRWIRLDAQLRRRLTQPAPRLSPSELLAAALTDEWVDPDDPSEMPEPVRLRVEGPWSELLGSLRPAGPGAAARVRREEPEPVGLTATLRPYQREGLAWLVDRHELGFGGILADDMGLGKTIQMLALQVHGRGSMLVVCPTSLVANWEREAARFAPTLRVVRHHGAGRDLITVEPGDLVITTYGIVRSDAEHLASFEFDLIVADEAQNMKNARSRTARAMRSLRGRSRFAVTGTPIENQLSELWSLLDWSVPGLLGPHDRFRRDVALPIERDDDRSAARRLSRLTQPFLLRRRKSDPGIAPELPPKTERNVIVPLTAEQVSLYRATTDEVMADVRANDGLVRQGMVLKLLTALKQITNHPAHYLGQSGPMIDRSGKLAMLDELLDIAGAAGEATLVFTQYVAMAELLAGHLAGRGFDVGLLHGGLSPAARQDLVDRFQTGDLGVLLLSLRAGGTGLNLTRATQVVHFDRWWNPAVEDQATDRAYRIGQDRPVTVHRLITEGTVEDRVAQLLEAKRDLANRVIGGAGESWLARLDDHELEALVGLRSADEAGVAT